VAKPPQGYYRTLWKVLVGQKTHAYSAATTRSELSTSRA
jgi:hypothetical protein